MNPFRHRLKRTVILTLLGYGLAFLLALWIAPAWPEFCDGSIPGAPCDVVATQTVAGYLVIVLGVLTMILGPIAGSLLDLYINGAQWETPRGTESIITNMPLLVGAIYLVTGVLIVATA